MSRRAAVVVVWPGCAWQEVAPAVALLAEVRAVHVASPRGELVRVREGYQLAPDGPLDDAPDDVAELVLPGGELDAVWHDGPALARLGALFRRAERTGAICNGVPLLARAVDLAGRRVTHTCAPRYAPRPQWDTLLDAVEPGLAPTTYVDEDVVVDGGLVTAKPWAALAFARALAAAARGRAEAAAAARYLGGARELPGDPYERWVVLLDTIPGVATPRDVVRAHVAWLEALEADGRLVAAGPFPDDAAGMLVLRVAGRAAAEALAAADPFVGAGVRRATLRRWTLSCADNDHLGMAVGR